MDPDRCETCGAKLTTRQALRSSSSARVSRHLTNNRQCYSCRQKELDRRKRYCKTCGVKLTVHNRSLNYKGSCHACGRKEFERRKEEIEGASGDAVVSTAESLHTPPAQLQQNYAPPYIQPDRKSPAIAALASLIIVGVGHFYVGKWWRGLGFMLLAIVFFWGTIWILGTGVIIIWIAAPIDAYNQAKKRNQKNGYPE